MKTRVITAVVAIACIFPFFWFSDPVGNNNPLNYVFPLLISGIAFISVWEFLHCVGLDKTYQISVPLMILGFVFPIITRMMQGMREEFIRVALLTALVTVIYLFAVIVFMFGKINIANVALCYMTCFYIVGANCAIIVLRDTPGVGRFLFLIPFIFGWVTDTFAYIFGKLFGKHKLIPTVSPKKTVEGSIGGIVFCALTTVLYGFIVHKAFGATPNYAVLIISGLLISVVSQIGDLILSAVKREFGIKDYGKMLPGHGGLLDRFDSSMAVTVLVTVVACYFPIFTV